MTSKLTGWNKYDVKVELNRKTDSDSLVIFLHGAYSSPYDVKKTKIQYLAQKLAANHSTAFFQTSRRFEWREKPKMSFEEYFKDSFKGKTFADELEDSKKATTKIILDYSKTSGKIKQPKITLVGFSLGGVIATQIANNFKDVDNVITIGTALSFQLPTYWRLISTMPSEKKLIKNLEAFLGSFHVLIAGEDETHNIKNSVDLFSAAQHSSYRSLTHWPGVDHRFQMLNGKNYENSIKKQLKIFIEDKISFRLFS